VVEGEPNAAFVGGQTLREPEKVVPPARPTPTRSSARASRTSSPARAFAHFLKKMCYDKIGSIKRRGRGLVQRQRRQNTLQKWINMYVEPNPGMVSMEQLAEKPLAAAEVVVNADPDDPGVYDAQFFLGRTSNSRASTSL